MTSFFDQVYRYLYNVLCIIEVIHRVRQKRDKTFTFKISQKLRKLIISILDYNIIGKFETFCENFHHFLNK